MKFTNGFWLMKDGILPQYAIEYSDHCLNGTELTVYASSKHISNRGDTLNSGLLTVQISSPRNDVIKVSITHFDGAVYRGPFAEIYEESADVRVHQVDTGIEYVSGKTRVVIDTRPNSWGLSFYDGQKLLTKTGYRNMAYMKDVHTGKHYMVEQLALDVDEYVYGLGERFTNFVKNGQSIDIWNSDGGTASEQAYKSIPFYITNKGYGVLVDNEGDVSFEVASEKVEFVQFSAESERLDYYFINGGSPKGTLQKYTDLVGKPALPPAWSFGLWLSTSFTTDYNEETAMSFIEGMRNRNIPLHVFHFDCFWMKEYEWCNFEWDSNVFPDPASMIQKYHDMGLKVCVWINPYIAQKSKLFAEGKKNGYFLRKKNGDIWQTDLWQAGMAALDFTNPDAKEWYLSKLKSLLNMGVDCFKTDFGERIPVKDIVYYADVDPVKMHNYYTYLYNQAVFELLEKEKGRGEAVLFARSATVGGQKFPVHWGGDCNATYASMAETLRGGLSLACDGFGFWSHDIGGFEETASADVYKRWCAFGLLSSHSRLHGSTSYRVPWLFDEEACDVLRKFVNLKCQMMPYLYSQAANAHETGIPMMRPMFVEFPEERACEMLDRQYMLGDSLLVAPVFKENGEVEYYLPGGTWINLLTGELCNGGAWKKEIHDIQSLPLLVRPNSIFVMGTSADQVVYDYEKKCVVYLSFFEDGAKSETKIVDSHGICVSTIRAERQGNTIYVSGVDSTAECRLLGKQEGLLIVCSPDNHQTRT